MALRAAERSVERDRDFPLGLSPPERPARPGLFDSDRAIVGRKATEQPTNRLVLASPHLTGRYAGPAGLTLG